MFKAEQPTERRPDEFADALGYIESLLRAVDAAYGEIRRARLFRLGVVFASVCVELVIVAVGPPWVWATAFGLLAIADGLVLAAVRSTVDLPLWRQIRRDEKVIVSAVSTLRELYPLVSQDQQWSSLRSGLDRGRLGRFPIESGE